MTAVVRLGAVRTYPTTGRWRRLVPPLVTMAALAAATAYVHAVDPNDPGHYPVCPTYALAGIYCPGCGMLRATHDLTHLDLAGAMARNPLAPLVLIAIIGGLSAWAWSRWTGRRIALTPAPWAPWVIGSLVVLLTVARNVPGWTWLSPA
jgi:hypothetical protein